MDFSIALNLCIKQGHKIWREGWNGKGMYVVYQKGYPNGVNINKNTAEATGIEEGTLCKFLPYLMMKTVDTSFTPWTPSQSDMVSEDWYSVCVNPEPPAKDYLVLVSNNEYNSLYQDSVFLECLRSGGVDNWDWYGEACDLFEERMGSND